jgi:hypothetical protein
MQQKKPTDEHHEHVVLGMLAAMAAFFMFSIMMVLAKMLSAKHTVI